MKTKYIVWFAILVGFVIVSGPFVYSFFFPGELEVVDEMRLPVQGSIMSSTADYLVDFPFIQTLVDEENPDNLKYEDVLPYFADFEPGDIAFTQSERYVSNEFIPGNWKHVFVYLGSYQQVELLFGSESEYLALFEEPDDILIIDSSSYGVVVRTFRDLSNLKYNSFLTSVANFRIDRSPQDIEYFIEYTLSQTGKNYDYDLLTDDDADLYCSELIYVSLKSIGIRLDIQTYELFGRDIVSPTNIAEYISDSQLSDNQFDFLLYIEKKDGVIVEHDLDYFKATLYS